jgi:hypothetical protein
MGAMAAIAIRAHCRSENRRRRVLNAGNEMDRADAFRRSPRLAVARSIRTAEVLRSWPITAA